MTMFKTIVCVSSSLLLLMLLVASKKSSDPVINVTQIKDRFVEDKVTNFTCLWNDSPSDRVIWMIRDPLTRLRTFYTHTLDDRKEMKMDHKNRSVFTLWMRRDFSDFDVVCQSPTGSQEGKYRLPKIKETIPIDAVRFTSVDLVEGRPLVLWCDVQAKTGIVKTVEFRAPGRIHNATGNWSIGGDWTRYHFNAKRKNANFEEHNGIRMQCVAVTKYARSNTGNVASRLATYLVHYFRATPTSSTQNVDKGSSVSVQFKVSANPAPMEKQLTLKRKTSKETLNGVSVNISKVTDFSFVVILKFTPAVEGDYEALFKSSLSNISSTVAHTIRIIFNPYFLTSRIEKKRITKGSMVHIRFKMFAKYKPSRQQLKCFLKSKPAKMDIAEPSFTEITQLQPFNYFVRMTLLPKEPGLCQMVFIGREKKETNGPIVGIDIIQNNSLLWKLCIPILICLLLIIVVRFVVVRRKHNRMIKKNFGTKVVSVRVGDQWLYLVPVDRTSSFADIFKPFVPLDLKYVKDIKVNDKKVEPFQLLEDEHHCVAKTSHRPSNDNFIKRFNICDGDFITASIAPSKIRYWITDASFKWRRSDFGLIHFDQGQYNWQHLVSNFRREYEGKYDFDKAIAFIFGRFYVRNKRTRLALQTKDPQTAYIDEEDGREIHPKNDTIGYFMKLLMPSSTFRWPPNKSPVVEVSMTTVVMEMSTDESFQVRPAQNYPEKWLMFVYLKSSTEPATVKHTLVRLKNEVEYADCVTSEVYNGDDCIVEAYSEVTRWRHEKVFFKDGDKLPHWGIPADKYINIFVRKNVNLVVDKSRQIRQIRNQGSRRDTCCSEWTTMTDVSAFEKEFTDVVRSISGPPAANG